MASADWLQDAQLLSLRSVSGLTDMERMCGIGLRKSCAVDPAAIVPSETWYCGGMPAYHGPDEGHYKL